MNLEKLSKKELIDYIKKIQKSHKKLIKSYKKLNKTLTKLYEENNKREEQEMLDYLVKDEERFNDYNDDYDYDYDYDYED